MIRRMFLFINTDRTWTYDISLVGIPYVRESDMLRRYWLRGD